MRLVKESGCHSLEGIERLFYGERQIENGQRAIGANIPIFRLDGTNGPILRSSPVAFTLKPV